MLVVTLMRSTLSMLHRGRGGGEGGEGRRRRGRRGEDDNIQIAVKIYCHDYNIRTCVVNLVRSIQRTIL